FIYRLATLRIRIFECPHRLSDKLLKSSAASLFVSGAGCAYYAFPLESQAFIFAFVSRDSQENLADPAACLPLFRVSGGAL
ncbi:hypothetical protein, partial [Kluyvera sichuanensis]|uniref:hypothetical protein n=2 Tax=Enterobacteriaceae TaxID=543 RepID=UPI001CC3EC56